ncbi:MAG: hypothetical protein QF448_07765 [Candidatus Thalassarchaeaceae archaeon]|jgi:hypothetical protein|nr:hypothetical protein [Candidatus Thalassarchaeaceae archaeon]
METPEAIRRAISHCDVAPLEVTLLVASTETPAGVALVEEGICLSKEAFLGHPTANQEMVSPIYVAVLDRHSPESAIELEDVYCDFIREHHPDTHRRSRCGPQYVPEDHGCDFGRCLFVDDRGEVVGSSISSNRQSDGFHLFINTSHDLPQHASSYLYVTLHELWHVFQISSISQADITYEELAYPLGKRLGSDPTVDTPWWMEGSATYFSHYFYAQHPEAGEDWLYQQADRGFWTDYNGSGLGDIIDQYRDSGRSLFDFQYGGSDHQVAYWTGFWYVAYLMEQKGIDTIFDFHAGLEEQGFEQSFVNAFGTSHTEFLEEFEAFIEKPRSEMLDIFTTAARTTTATTATIDPIAPAEDEPFWNEPMRSLSDGRPVPSCGDGFTFTGPVVDADDVESVMFHPGGHVTPHDHMAYWSTGEPTDPSGFLRSKQVQLTAPADVFAMDLGWEQRTNEEEDTYLEWGASLTFCDGHIAMFGHVGQPTDELLEILNAGVLLESMSDDSDCNLGGDEAAAAGEGCRRSIEASVPAGTALFHSSGMTSGFDFGLSLVGLTVDELTEHPSYGFSIMPWRSGSGKSVCPLDYFPEPWNSDYLALLASDRCGPFNQDVPETAMGLWFPSPSLDQPPPPWEPWPNEEFDSIWLFAYHDDSSKHELTVPDDSFGLEYGNFVIETRDEETVNRRWDEVVAGDVYCAELLQADSAFSHESTPSAIALLELSTDGQSLTIEGYARSECVDGLDFGGRARIFYR